MGSSSSKFKKYLQHGDEYAAMQVYQHSAELRRSLQPNCSYGDNHHHNTPMHYAAKHGMKHLIRAFLNDLGGNPNMWVLHFFVLTIIALLLLDWLAELLAIHVRHNVIMERATSSPKWLP